jgi:hypothetical protein
LVGVFQSCFKGGWAKNVEKYGLTTK